MAIQEKSPLIFISHSSKNKEKVSLFVDLLCRLNLVPQKDILCSSLPGFGIPVGQNIFEFLRTRFEQYDMPYIIITFRTARRITARLSECAKSVKSHGNLKTMKYYPCHTRTGPALDVISG